MKFTLSQDGCYRADIRIVARVGAIDFTAFLMDRILMQSEMVNHPEGEPLVLNEELKRLAKSKSAFIDEFKSHAREHGKSYLEFGSGGVENPHLEAARTLAKEIVLKHFPELANDQEA